MSESGSAYQALASLARQALGAAKGLPAQVDIQPQWSGVGFSVLEHRYVAPMGQVTETLEVPVYTRLPGVQPWVRGVSNVRGRLVPIIDLAAFFGGKLQGARKRRRIMILEQGELTAGLLVDQVFGMQHFPIDTFSKSSPSAEAIQPFTTGGYQKDGIDWTIFQIQQLVDDPSFANVALTGV